MSELSELDQRFIDAITEAVKTKGEDYTYPEEEMSPGDEGFPTAPMCRYVTTDGRPSCIIGHALWNMGITVPPQLEGKNAGEALFHLLPGLSVGVVHAASEAQDMQDAHETWGEALKAFTTTLSSWVS